MAGIAGVLGKGERKQVEKMLEKIRSRGKYGIRIIEKPGCTAGIVWSQPEDERIVSFLKNDILSDGPGFGQMAIVSFHHGDVVLTRDILGVSPLYYARSSGIPVAFSSEVKPLLSISEDIHELAPGHRLKGDNPEKYYTLEKKRSLPADPDRIALELRGRMTAAITNRIRSDTAGIWLSGGLDSSTIAALLSPKVKHLHTFCAGVKGAPDFEYAREVATHVGSQHHEVYITMREMIAILPDVIYNLESFDALLVRSGIVNFLAAKTASDHVGEVFSGEGGDEFFGGYLYLKSIPAGKLEDELIDIAGRLHNTAFQRVDRSASAFGLVPHVIFADPDVFQYALKIPSALKIRDGIEKWILRKAISGLLPERVLWRTKAKFWEGAGIGEMMSEYSCRIITDRDFQKERKLKNGWILNSKEELYYYRIFRDFFGDLENLQWMGRTK